MTSMEKIYVNLKIIGVCMTDYMQKVQMDVVEAMTIVENANI